MTNERKPERVPILLRLTIAIAVILISVALVACVATVLVREMGFVFGLAVLATLLLLAREYESMFQARQKDWIKGAKPRTDRAK